MKKSRKQIEQAGRQGKRDERFEQLLALAREGNEEAVSDLFKEYGFQYGRDEE